ncbi:hypothetical protein CRUP_024975 [Coryphaenoides rupestris]|nr:hypothetical protein CRUP_024975 [Coryphaenoides rupestris]
MSSAEPIIKSKQAEQEINGIRTQVGLARSSGTTILVVPDAPLTHVCAKNLATSVSQEAGNRPVLLGLALKDSSIEAVKLMRDLIKSCQVW